MYNILDNLCELAKSVRYQNLFSATKEIYGIKLFRNSMNLSNIQNIFLSYLYSFDTISRDMVIDRISKHVFDNKIYWESYLIWKQKNIKKTKNAKSEKGRGPSNFSLVAGKHINFNKEVK